MTPWNLNKIFTLLVNRFQKIVGKKGLWSNNRGSWKFQKIRIHNDSCQSKDRYLDIFQVWIHLRLSLSCFSGKHLLNTEEHLAIWNVTLSYIDDNIPFLINLSQYWIHFSPYHYICFLSEVSHFLFLCDENDYHLMLDYIP